MKNKIISFLMLMVIVFSVMTPAMSFAEDSESLHFKVLSHKIDGEIYSYSISFKGQIKKGDAYTIKVPFVVEGTLEELKKFFDVETEENVITLTAKSDANITEGFIEGEKRIHNQNEVSDIIINGEVDTSIDKPSFTPNEGSGHVSDRDYLTKEGTIQSDGTIQWIITVHGGPTGTQSFKLYDDIGTGLENQINDFTVNTGSTIGEGNSSSWDSTPALDVVYSTETDGSHKFIIPELLAYQVLTITYKTKIIDFSQNTFENSIYTEKDGKSESTIVEYRGSSGIEAEELTSLKIVKEWHFETDEGKLKKQPIKANIYYNGTLFKEVELNKENNWTQEFNMLTKGEYTVVELTEIEGFTTSYHKNDDGDLIILNKENTPEPSIPILPQVGEKFFSVRGLLILCLLLLGIYGLRGRE